MPIKVRAIGSRKHHLCGVILDIYRKAFARAGLNGVSALCARRTIAKRLTERGCDVDQIGAVLGLKERNSVRNLIPNEHESLQSRKRSSASWCKHWRRLAKREIRHGRAAILDQG